MASLFEAAGLDRTAPLPLADRLRPERLEDVVKRADLRMLDAKRRHYEDVGYDSRALDEISDEAVRNLRQATRR